MAGGEGSGLTWDQALGWRLAQQGLADPARPRAAEEVAGALCGVHAQVLSCAQLAMSVRSSVVDPKEVDAALFDDRRLVKTWMQRGTLHVFPSVDLPIYVAAKRTRSFHLRPRWLRENGLSAEDSTALTEAVPLVLDGRCLTREELVEELVARTGRSQLAEALGSGFGELLKPAAFHGYLCFGPNRGRNITFMHPRDWLGGAWEEPDTDAAMAEVLRRYLAVYAPATAAEFSRWWGTLNVGAARKVRESLGDEVVDLEIDGTPVWVLASELPAMREHAPSDAVRLLPGFDPYVVAASRDVEHILPQAAKSRVHRFGAWVSPVLLIGGRIAGVWKSEARKSELRIEVEPFRPLTRAERGGLDEQAEAIAELLGGEPRVSVSSPT